MTRGKICFSRILALVAACAFTLGFAGKANAQTVQESSVENRFQLDFHVPDAQLTAMLPAGGRRRGYARSCEGREHARRFCRVAMT